MKYLSGLAAVLLAAGTANAQSMNAETFHQRATKLQKKGALAVFSRGEINALMTEIKAASSQARERRLADVEAGLKPRYCPPEGPQSLRSDELMSRLNSIPAADRARIDMTEAMTRILATKYPCSKA